jgi:hypothetical protein
MIRPRRRDRPKRQLRCLPQGACACDIERSEMLPCRFKMLFGLAQTAGGTQQSKQGGVDQFICRLEEGQRPSVRQSVLGYALKPGYQRRQQAHAQAPRRITFSDAPALKLLAIRQIEPLEEVALKRPNPVAQGLGRELVQTASSDAAQRKEVHRATTEVEANVLPIGDDPRTAGLVDKRP